MRAPGIMMQQLCSPLLSVVSLLRVRHSNAQEGSLKQPKLSAGYWTLDRRDNEASRVTNFRIGTSKLSRAGQAARRAARGVSLAGGAAAPAAGCKTAGLPGSETSQSLRVCRSSSLQPVGFRPKDKHI